MRTRRARAGVIVAILVLLVDAPEPGRAQERDASIGRSRITVVGSPGLLGLGSHRHAGVEAQFGGSWRLAPEIWLASQALVGTVSVVRAFQPGGPGTVTFLLGAGVGGVVVGAGGAGIAGFLGTRAGIELPLFWPRGGFRVGLRGLHAGRVSGVGLQLGLRVW